MRLSIGATLSQMHSGSGFWQCGQSAITSASAGPGMSDIAALYAACRKASTAQIARGAATPLLKLKPGISPAVSPPPMERGNDQNACRGHRDRNWRQCRGLDPLTTLSGDRL